MSPRAGLDRSLAPTGVRKLKILFLMKKEMTTTTIIIIIIPVCKITNQRNKDPFTDSFMHVVAIPAGLVE